MKCYVVFFSEHPQETPFLQKIFLSKKEAHDYVEFRNWQCKHREKMLAEKNGWDYDESEPIEEMWVEERDLF